MIIGSPPPCVPPLPSLTWSSAFPHRWTTHSPYRPQAEAEELLQEQYPHFLPAWRRLNATVLKGDIIRYFIMDSIGGLYLDMDIECFWRAEPDLRHGSNA